MLRVMRCGAVVGMAMLFGLLPGVAQAQPGPNSALGLEITAGKSSYPMGEPIRLTFAVTNRGQAPCRLAAIPDGAVSLTAVTRDGAAVTRDTGRVDYRVGYSGTIRDSVRTVPANGKAEFTVSAVAGADLATAVPLSTVSPLPSQDAVSTLWRLDQPGRYQVKAVYAAPRVDGDGPPRCAGATNLASVEFTVTETAGWSFPWAVFPVFGFGALIVGGLILVLILLARRRTAGVAVLTLVVLLGSELVQSRVAEAASIADCQASYNATNGDPAGLKDWMAGALANGQLKIKYIEPPEWDSTVPYHDKLDKDGKRAKVGSTIYWVPNDRREVPNEPGVFSDPCGDLYHELVHARDWAEGTYDDKDCVPGSGPPFKEVKATLYENAYRKSRYTGPGSAERTHYGLAPLPTGSDIASILSSCDGQPKAAPAPPPKKGWLDKLKDFARTVLDPHLNTYDHTNFGFQAVGEFVASKAGPEFEVQTRQAALPHNADRTVSINTAVALKVGADKLGFYLDNNELVVRLNTKVYTVPKDETKLPGGGSVTRVPPAQPNAYDGYGITWPDGSAVHVGHSPHLGVEVTVAPAADRRSQLVGLLGDFDGNRENDLKTRDGKVIAQPAEFEQLYRTFGDSWRVSQAESLFDYAQGENTQKFTDRTFPERPITLADLPENVRNQAKAVCVAAGVTDPALLDDCTLDAALTGQPTVAAAATSVQRLLPNPKAKPVDPVKPEPTPGPVDPKQPLKDGDLVRGKINTAGQRDGYRLDLGQLTDVQFVAITGNISIEPQAGAWKKALVTDAWRFSGTSREQNEVAVSKPDNGTGEYSFRVVALKVRRFEVKIGDKIGKGGVPGTGRLDVPGRVDVYSMDAGEAEKIDLSGARGCGYWAGTSEDSPEATVVSPYPFGGNAGDACQTLPMPIHAGANKRFQLVIWSDEAKTLDYEFRLAAAER